MPKHNQLYQIKGVTIQEKQLDYYRYSPYSQKLKQRFPLEEGPVTCPYRTAGEIIGL